MKAMRLNAVVMAGLVPGVLGACTMVGTVPTEPPGPSPAIPGQTLGGEPASTKPRSDSPVGTTEASASPIAAQVVDLALESIGTPYRWGGTDANGFDCSGLIQFAYAELGISLPRTSAAQIRTGTPVVTERTHLRPGDILGFSDGGGPRTEHVGLYVGGDEFIHSSSQGVRISSLESRYWQERLVAARRVLD